MSRKYDSGALSIPLAVSSLWTTFNVLSKGLVLIFVFPFSLFLLSHSEVMILDIVRIFFPKRSFLSCIIKKLNDLRLHDSSMFVFLKVILSFSFRSFFDTLIFYRFVFKTAIPEEIHANQELFTESLAIFREERYGGSHLFEISEPNRQFSSVPYFSRSNSFGSQKHKGKKS